MKKPVLVETHHVRISIFLTVRKVLRAALGKGDHEPLAGKIADQVAEDFDRARWRVQMPAPTPPATPASRAPGD